MYNSFCLIYSQQMMTQKLTFYCVLIEKYFHFVAGSGVEAADRGSPQKQAARRRRGRGHRRGCDLLRRLMISADGGGAFRSARRSAQPARS